MLEIKKKIPLKKLLSFYTVLYLSAFYVLLAGEEDAFLWKGQGRKSAVIHTTFSHASLTTFKHKSGST